MRAVPEWRGKSDDTAIPARVKLRVFEKYKGTCYLSGRKILAGDKWEVEHIIALANGGEHREDNLAPALIEPHKEKTKADRKITSKIARVRKKHLGLIKPKGRSMPGSKISGWKRTFDGKWVKR
jgi:5-methylcytosine-specific restriction endonuclease McrA